MFWNCSSLEYVYTTLQEPSQVSLLKVVSYAKNGSRVKNMATIPQKNF